MKSGNASTIKNPTMAGEKSKRRKSEEKDGFVLYKSQYEPIMNMSLEQKGRLLDAIYQHALGKQFDIPDPFVSVAFGFIRTRMDNDSRRYDEMCNKNKANARMRYDRGNAAAACGGIRPHAKRADKDKDMDKDMDMDGDKDKEIDLDKDGDTATAIPGAGKPASSSSSSIPTIEEVEEEIAAKGYAHVTPQEFWDYNQARGWNLANGRPLKDWCAALRMMERHHARNGDGNGSHAGQGRPPKPADIGGTGQCSDYAAEIADLDRQLQMLRE